MNWDAIGAFGELIGAAAVIVSVVYLAIQIRASRVSEKKLAIEASYYSYDNIRSLLIENEDVARIFIDGLEDPERLTEYELFRFMAISETMFLNTERYWVQLENTDDSRLNGALGFLAYYKSTPGGQAFWEHPQSNNLDPDFRQLVENHKADELPRLPD